VGFEFSEKLAFGNPGTQRFKGSRKFRLIVRIRLLPIRLGRENCDGEKRSELEEL